MIFPKNGSRYSSTNILNNPDVSFEQLILENQAIFLSENKVYFVLDNINNTFITTYDLKIQLWEYNISTSTATKIYENSYGTGQPAQQEQIYLSVNQGYLYIEDIKKKTSTTADYYIQRYEGIWNPKSVSENKPYRWNQRSLYVSNSYNLLKLFLFPVNPRRATWYFPVIKEIYNPNQYNGDPYTNVDSLVPEYANLYSNNELVFSRNLYNVTKQSNSTMSSVEVPYNYLNDLGIIQNDLISKTNQELINDYTNWNKNIYEIVDVNFLNTINVIDEDTNISYLDSAIKVNNAITDGGNTNYQNTPCTKYRLNYTDNTSSIGSITWSDINDLVKQTTISFIPAKEVKSINLISNDESTIYMTINETFEKRKLYTITQKVRIGNKPVKKEGHYQGNNVCYNNKKIEVYSN